MTLLKSLFVAAFCLPTFVHAANPQVQMKTSVGDVTIELYADKAPVSVKNFLSYVDSGHYKDTVFHRVIKDFMIQGGGFSMKGGVPTEKKTQKPIRNERANGLTNDKYTLAMARTSDVDSATSQFFINTKDNAFLNYNKSDDASGYAVFGKVIKGMEVIDKIEEVETAEGKLSMHHPSGQLMTSTTDDVPVKPIIIESITHVKAEAAAPEVKEEAAAPETKKEAAEKPEVAPVAPDSPEKAVK